MKESPTYEDIGDQVESVEVLYDPDVVSYEQLLEVFWKSHDPAGKPYANQYSSLVLAPDAARLAQARRSAERYEQTSGGRVMTRIETLDRFYPAEDYHQKYYLRQDRTLAQELYAIFGEDQDAFRDSTAAARVNGYVAGEGTPAQLATEIGSLGLTDHGAKYLTDKVAEGAAAAGCEIP